MNRLQKSIAIQKKKKKTTSSLISIFNQNVQMESRFQKCTFWKNGKPDSLLY